MKTLKELREKSSSQAQQKMMGMALAYKRGEMDDASPEVKKMADSMSMKDLEDFAKTKHKGLPKKVEESALVSEKVSDDDWVHINRVGSFHNPKKDTIVGYSKSGSDPNRAPKLKSGANAAMRVKAAKERGYSIKESVELDENLDDWLNKAKRKIGKKIGLGWKLTPKEMAKRVRSMENDELVSLYTTYHGTKISKASMETDSAPIVYNLVKREIERRNINKKIAELDEAFTPKEIKMAIGVASDKRYAGGNMTGAANAIEKIKKGLSNHPQVKAVLQRQNESVQEATQINENNTKFTSFDQWMISALKAKKIGGSPSFSMNGKNVVVFFARNLRGEWQTARGYGHLPDEVLEGKK